MLRVQGLKEELSEAMATCEELDQTVTDLTDELHTKVPPVMCVLVAKKACSRWEFLPTEAFACQILTPPPISLFLKLMPLLLSLSACLWVLYCIVFVEK